jgi:hypothetical protein
MMTCPGPPRGAAVWVASTVLFLCIPARGAEILACPAWEITVVDESGKPMAGCAVVQEWGCQFRGGYADGSAAGLTDAAGKVQFPARNVSPPPMPPGKKVQRGIDRPVDQRPAASVTVSKSGCKFEWLRSRNEPRNVYTREGIQTRVVLKREKPG